MTAAGAAIEGFRNMIRVPLGYQPQHVMSVGIPIREDAHITWADRTRFFTELRDKIAAMPGVLSAGLSTNATPPNSGWRQPIEVMGKPAGQSQEAAVELVGPEYFATLQIPVLSGRLWDASEIARGATLVVVNQSFVRRYLSGGSTAGHSVRMPQFATLPPAALTANGAAGWLEIIGVVGDSLNDGLNKPVAPAVYAPYTLLMFPRTQVLVRTQGDPLAMLHSIKQQIASVDADQQTAGDTLDLEGWIQREPEYAQGRLVSMLFGAFSILALVLAAVGLYSVVSYTLLQRTGELGVRIALGAQRSDVLRIVGVTTGTGVGLGILVGLGLSFSLNRMIAQWIANGTRDPLVVLGVSVILLAVAALAAMVPARRALAINPIEALRSE